MNSAITFFEERLRWQTDPADLAAARMSGAFTGVLVDVRSEAAWEQGRIPGAVHLPSPALGPDGAVSSRLAVATWRVALMATVDGLGAEDVRRALAQIRFVDWAVRP